MNKEEYEKNLKILKKKHLRKVPLFLALAAAMIALIITAGKIGAFACLFLAGITISNISAFLSDKIYDKWIASDEEREAETKIQNSKKYSDLY